MKSLLSFVFCIALSSVLAAESAFAYGAVAQFRGAFQDASITLITLPNGDTTAVDGVPVGNVGIVGIASGEASQEAANEAAMAACNTDLDALRARVARINSDDSTTAEYELRTANPVFDYEGNLLDEVDCPIFEDSSLEDSPLEVGQWVVRVHVNTSDDEAILESEFDAYGIGNTEAAARAAAIARCPVEGAPPDNPEDPDPTICMGADSDDDRYLAVRVSEPSNTGGSSASSSDDDSNTAAYILGGAAAIAIAAYFLSGGDWGLFSATPDFGYSITESGYAYNYGGRVDFRKERWHLYWTAGQNNADGETSDFRYVSGGEYKADLWSAAFSERVQGETADYDLSLSAKYDGGVWTLSPAYRLHSRFEREQNGWQSETENSLSLEGALRADRWTVRSAAGFQWREAEDFGDNAQLKISAVRNL